MSSAKIALVSLAVLGFPLASASGEIDAGLLVVRVEDAHGTDCSPPIAGLCLFNVTGVDGGPGNATLNVSQTIDYVGIATNLSLVRKHVGELWIVPGESVTIYASQHYATHPVNRILVEAWQSVADGHWPVEERPLNATSEEVTLGCYCPGTAAGGDITRSQNRTYTLTPWSDHCITYEHIGPCNAYPTASTDFVINGNVKNICKLNGVPCDALVSPAVGAVQGQSPNVVFGIQYEEAQVATDPSNLSRDAPQRHASSSAPITSRRYGGEQPPTHRDRDPPPAGPLATSTPEHSIWQEGETIIPARPRGREPSQIETHREAPGPRPVLALVATAAAVGLAMALLGFGLYSRFSSKRELLTSPMRRRILRMVQENPGLHVRELARKVGLSRQTVTHHVLLLQRAHLLEARKDGWRMRLYLRGAEPPKTPMALQSLPALRQVVLSMVSGAPDGVRRVDLQDALESVPRRKRNKALKCLLEEGLIDEVQGEDGERRLRLPVRHVSGA